MTIMPIVSRAGAEVLLDLDEDGIDHLRLCLDAIHPRVDEARTADVEHGPDGSVIVCVQQPWERPGVIGALAPALLVRYVPTEDES